MQNCVILHYMLHNYTAYTSHKRWLESLRQLSTLVQSLKSYNQPKMHADL